MHIGVTAPYLCGFWYGHPYIPVHFGENVLYLKYLVHSGVMLQVLHSKFLVKFNMIISVACFLSQYLALNRSKECVNSGGCPPRIVEDE